jgi:nitrogen PTS system EIIA component
VPLATLIRPDLVFPELPAGDRLEVLRCLADRIAERGLVRDREALFQQLWDREQLGSTGIGGGVAIPHCRISGLARGAIAVGVVPQGVDFAAADGEPVRLLFVVIAPGDAPGEHLKMLAAISRWLKSGRHREEILALREPSAIYRLLQQDDD